MLDSLPQTTILKDEAAPADDASGSDSTADSGSKTDDAAADDSGSSDAKTADDSGSSDAKAADDSGSSDTKTTDDSGSSDSKTADDSGSSDSKTADDSGSSDAKTTDDSGSSDAKTSDDSGSSDSKPADDSSSSEDKPKAKPVGPSLKRDKKAPSTNEPNHTTHINSQANKGVSQDRKGTDDSENVSQSHPSSGRAASSDAKVHVHTADDDKPKDTSNAKPPSGVTNPNKSADAENNYDPPPSGSGDPTNKVLPGKTAGSTNWLEYLGVVIGGIVFIVIGVYLCKCYNARKGETAEGGCKESDRKVYKTQIKSRSSHKKAIKAAIINNEDEV